MRRLPVVLALLWLAIPASATAQSRTPKTDAMLATFGLPEQLMVERTWTMIDDIDALCKSGPEAVTERVHLTAKSQARERSLLQGVATGPAAVAATKYFAAYCREIDSSPAAGDDDQADVQAVVARMTATQDQAALCAGGKATVVAEAKAAVQGLIKEQAVKGSPQEMIPAAVTAVMGRCGEAKRARAPQQ